MVLDFAVNSLAGKKLGDDFSKKFRDGKHYGMITLLVHACYTVLKFVLFHKLPALGCQKKWLVFLEVLVRTLSHSCQQFSFQQSSLSF